MKKDILLIICLFMGMFLIPSDIFALVDPTMCHCPDGSSVFVGTKHCTDECGAGLVCTVVGIGEEVCEDPNATEPEPEPDPEPAPEPTGEACAAVPSLEHFTLTQNECGEDEINFVFAPNGTPHFYLHVNLKFENGRDILSAWCTGDETLCKAVGNGQNCGADRTGPNAWCYAAE